MSKIAVVQTLSGWVVMVAFRKSDCGSNRVDMNLSIFSPTVLNSPFPPFPKDCSTHAVNMGHMAS